MVTDRPVQLFLLEKENLSVHLGIRPSSAERCGLPVVLLLTLPELSASDVFVTSCDRIYLDMRL